jgi:hypothetical protein
MVLAMPIRNGKISAYLHQAESLLLVHIEGHQERFRESMSIHCETLMGCVYALSELAVDVLVCGATATEVPPLLRRGGIHVIPGIRGEPEPVVAAYLSGLLAGTHGGEGYLKSGAA